MIGFTMDDSVSHRLQSVGVDKIGAPVILMAMMGTRQGRRGETESVVVFFGANGAVIRGEAGATPVSLNLTSTDVKPEDILVVIEKELRARWATRASTTP